MNSKIFRLFFLFFIMPLLLLLSIKFLINNEDKIKKEESDYTKINVSQKNPLAQDKTFEDLLGSQDLFLSLKDHLYDYDKEMNMSETSIWYKPLSGLNYDMAYEQSLQEKNKIDSPDEFKKIKDQYNTLGILDSLSNENLAIGDILDYLNKYYLYGYKQGQLAAKKIYLTYINQNEKQLSVNKIDLTNGSQIPTDNTKLKNAPIKLDELFNQYSSNMILKKAVQISYNCYGDKNCYNSAINTLNFHQKIFLLVFISLSNEDKNEKLSKKQIEEETTKMMLEYLNNDQAKKSIILTGFMEGYTKSM